MAKDLYEILGLTKETFNEEALKKNYKRAALKYHPDRQTGKSDTEKKEAEEKFKEISHAYDVLSDEQKRKNYDMFGDENGQGGAQGNPFGGFGGFNPFGGFPGFEEFNPFGGSSRRSQRNQVQPGRDIQMKIPVTIEDIFNGCKKTVKYNKNVRCVSCHGSGGSGQKTCPKCHGAGRIITKQAFGMGGISIHEEVCPLCHGTGLYVEKKCDKCGGSGFEKTEVKLDIEFPSGVQDTEYVVYKNQGSEAKNPTGVCGSFIAIADYKIDNDRYTINGLDVVEHVHIPYYKLLVGCSYTINIPNGTSKTVKIQSCVKEGTIMRLSGEGLKRPDDQKGDYYICIHYLIPDKLSDIEKEKLNEISDKIS